jgi:ATP diphosphatase
MPNNKPSIFESTKANLTTSLLAESAEIQAKCAQVGFDWPSAEPVFEKVEEELAEIKEALANPQKSHTDVVEEVGDLLFASVNLCRHLDVDPDVALSLAKQKFVDRFQLLEELINSAAKDISQLSLPELEAYWLEAKARLDNK